MLATLKSLIELKLVTKQQKYAAINKDKKTLTLDKWAKIR